MPDPTLLLILALVFLPGACGDAVYRHIAGVRWGENQWQYAIRLFGFSLGGLLLYSLLGLVGAPAPIYLFPNYVRNIEPAGVPAVALAYLGHLIGGMSTGAGVALSIRVLAKGVGSSAYPCAWDAFVRESAPGHWVCVALENGQTYLGTIKVADTSVAKDERDLVLSDPAAYHDALNDYIAVGYRQLFIPCRLISSIAVLPNPDDQGLLQFGESAFSGKENHGNERTAAASA